MDLGLNGKVVLVTGGSKGIGLACAKAFLAEGAKVAIVSRSKVNLVAADRQLKAAGQAGEVVKVAADLIDPANARRMVAEVEQALGPIDVLVNSAGAAKRTPADDLTPEAWRAAMDAKYFTYVHAIDAVIKGMASRKRGAIVNVIGSGGKVASPTHLPGGAANAALMLATAGLANAYGGARHPRERRQPRRDPHRPAEAGHGSGREGGGRSRPTRRSSAPPRASRSDGSPSRTRSRTSCSSSRPTRRAT